jgi:type 1 glutamine amidotransferase
MKTFTSLLCLATAAWALNATAADKKIVLLAGGASHGSGDHEHLAGCLLFKQCLDQVPGVTSAVYSNGWPSEVSAFEGADAVVIYSDGDAGHPFLRGNRLQVIDALAQKGVGIGCIHFAVEVPKEKAGTEFLSWIGGYFETYHSVNPFWEADFKTLPEHPVTRGVKPFKQRDEWYYHMRFQPEMKGVSPILSAVPPESTRGKPGANTPRAGNPDIQKHAGEPEHVMWVYDRPEGGRGFGFTGGHSHQFWGNENFRKVVLNAILWSAKTEVPEKGVACPVAAEDLQQNLDKKK